MEINSGFFLSFAAAEVAFDVDDDDDDPEARGMKENYDGQHNF